MYLITNDTRYPCAGAPSLSGDTLTFVLPDGGPEELGPTVELYMDDGFHLVTLEVSGYLRWVMSGDTLTITNLPEGEPLPDVPAWVPPNPNDAAFAQALVDLQYQVDKMKLEGMMPK